jgi:hypothetical protein
MVWARQLGRQTLGSSNSMVLERRWHMIHLHLVTFRPRKAAPQRNWPGTEPSANSVTFHLARWRHLGCSWGPLGLVQAAAEASDALNAQSQHPHALNMALKMKCVLLPSPPSLPTAAARMLTVGGCTCRSSAAVSSAARTGAPSSNVMPDDARLRSAADALCCLPCSPPLKVTGLAMVSPPARLPIQLGIGH